MKYQHVFTGEVVEAMQLPAEDDPSTEALLHWLGEIELHDEFFESGRDGALIIHNTKDPEEAPPEHWIVKLADGQISHFAPELFAEFFKEVGGVS